MSQALDYLNHYGIDREKLPTALKDAVEVLEAYEIDLAEENLYEEVSRTANAYRLLDIQTHRDLQVWFAKQKEHPVLIAEPEPESEPKPEEQAPEHAQPATETDVKFEILINFLRSRKKTLKIWELRDAGYDVSKLLAEKTEVVHSLRISKKGRLFPYYEIGRA
ncbi:hypothetical protein [Rhodoflexus sp.]